MEIKRQGVGLGEQKGKVKLITLIENKKNENQPNDRKKTPLHSGRDIKRLAQSSFNHQS